MLKLADIKKNSVTSTIFIRVTKKTHNKLKKLAKEHSVPMSTYVRALIEHILEKE